MNSIPLPLRALAVTAMFDWLVGRTLLRAAFFMPKPPAVAALFEATALASQLAANAAALLALFVLANWIWRDRVWVVVAPVSALVALGLLAVVIPDRGWLTVAYHAAAAASLVAAVRHPGGAASSPSPAVALVAIGLAAGLAAHLAGAIQIATGWALPAFVMPGLLRASEVVTIFGVAAQAWRWGRPFRLGPWALAAVPAVGVAVLALSAPSMAGVLAIWSTGSSWFLPYPVYGAALWLAAAAALTALPHRPQIPLGILLLFAGGLAPQMTSHFAFSLIGLRLLAGTEAASVAERRGARPASELAPPWWAREATSS